MLLQVDESSAAIESSSDEARPAVGFPADGAVFFASLYLFGLFLWSQLPLAAERFPDLIASSSETGEPLQIRLGLPALRTICSIGTVVFLLGSGVALCLWRPRWMMGLFSIALGHVMTFAIAEASIDGAYAKQECASTSRFEPQWEKFGRIRIVDGYSHELYSFNPRDSMDSSIDSFGEIARRLLVRFEAKRETIQHELGTSESETRVIFALHVAATWWSFGNQAHPDLEGCAINNEANGRVDAKTATPRTYLQASIGCCSDMSYLMKALLDHQKIPNRLTSFPGHVFNEVFLDGRWRIADPSIYAFADRSWEDLYANGSKDLATVTVFAHPHLRAADQAQFRDLTGRFRLMMLQRMGTRPDSLRFTYHPELPAPFAETPEPRISEKLVAGSN